MKTTHWPHPRTTRHLLVAVCLAFTLTLFLFPSKASAASIHLAAPSAAPAMQVSAGFNSRYRDGNWVPIQVALSNDGPDFTGSVSINTASIYAGSGLAGTSYVYQQTVSLPNNSQKQVTLYVPFTLGSQGTTQNITIDLLDANGQKVNTQQTTLRSLNTSDIFVGFLSDQAPGFGSLTNVALPNQTSSVLVEPLHASTMPTIAEALKNFDILIIDNFTTSSLNKDQLAALRSWVHQGGRLVAIGGPEWRHTLGPIADLLPVSITGTNTVPAGTHLFPLGGPDRGGPDQNQTADTLSAPIPVSVATTHPGNTVVLSSNNMPLIVQASQDKVSYLAFDPWLDPLANWSGMTTLWKGLLLRTLGDQLLYTNATPNFPSVPNQFQPYNAGMSALLQSLFPSAIPSTWLILALLLSYVVVLGPVRFLIVRRLKNRSWSWRIVLSTIVVFSLLSYGLALQQKGTSILSSSISVIQLNRPNATGSLAHSSTYVGVFVPNNGDFQVHIPGNNLVQPVDDQNFGIQNSVTPQRTTVTSASDGTNVDLQGVDIWTLRSLVSRHDHQVTGGILSHLTAQNNVLTGTVTNTLSYGLSNAYVLIGNQFLSLGHIAAGETKQVNLTIFNNPPPTGTNRALLADQIASSNGLPTPYGPYSYTNNSSPTELQRRMAMLSTLSGESGGYCGPGACYQAPIIAQGAITKRAILSPQGGMTIIYSGGGGPVQLNTTDPLLIPGAPATLIGWADHLPDDENAVTVNGTYATKSQEAVVQAPLDVSFSGSINVPSSLVTSQIVDAQNLDSNFQVPFPGTYQMGTGSITFEYTLSGISNVQAGNISFSDPTAGNGGVGPYVPGPGQQNTINRLHASLYNWQTGKWDAFTFNQSSLSLNNAQAYVGPGGRILLQLANQDTTLGTTTFSKPVLQLQGTIPS